MIRVTVELVPHGIGTPVVIGSAKIYNDGTGTLTTGNYKGYLCGKNGRRLRHDMEVTNFKRKRENVWELIRRALDSRLDP